jgi:hypothetical protein
MSWVRLAEDPGRATSVLSEIWAGPFAVSRAAGGCHSLKSEIGSVVPKQLRMRLGTRIRRGGRRPLRAARTRGVQRARAECSAAFADAAEPCHAAG